MQGARRDAHLMDGERRAASPRRWAASRVARGGQNQRALARWSRSCASSDQWSKRVKPLADGAAPARAVLDGGARDRSRAQIEPHGLGSELETAWNERSWTIPCSVGEAGKQGGLS